jgi:hypothetical protein
MQSHKHRLFRLELRAQDQTAQLIEEIVIHRTYEDREEREEDTEYIKVTQLDQEGVEVASVYIPKNGRDEDLPLRD